MRTVTAIESGIMRGKAQPRSPGSARTGGVSRVYAVETDTFGVMGDGLGGLAPRLSGIGHAEIALQSSALRPHGKKIDVIASLSHPSKT